MANDAPAAVYQLHVWLCGISPMIWRWLLVRSDSTIADLHYTLQITFGWTDFHLHRFVIYGKDYGIAHSGGIHFADDPAQVRLRDLHFRLNTRFQYEYDLCERWLHQIRLERVLPVDPDRVYPYCVGGARSAPPEDCGGPWAFLALKQHYSPYFIAERLVVLLEDDPHAIDVGELQTLQGWLTSDQFDRRGVNRRLRAYACGDADWWRIERRRKRMKITVQLIIEPDNDTPTVVTEVACLQRADLTPETLGLTLAEAKERLARVQETMVTQQATTYVSQQRACAQCGVNRSCKGHHQIVVRTLFGKLQLASPRLHTCTCQVDDRRSFSPLADLLPERTAPELRYLQAKWAALVSYGVTVDLLEEVLPIHADASTVMRQVHRVAERMEDALGDEQWSFIDGCQRDWDQLPIPDRPLTVGIDRGYVHARDGDNRKAGWCELIVGKSIPSDGAAKRFGFVTGYDTKPKRRLFEVLKGQGLQMNQTVTFLSDAGDNVRDLQLYLSPQAEHLLDWFHVTMRITLLQQLGKELRAAAQPPGLDTLAVNLEQVKWYLWHGNVFRALQEVENVQDQLDVLEQDISAVGKLAKAVREFAGYIRANEAFIPNYGDRYRHGETISTAFVESTVNQVISKRMVKKQQMRWTKRGAHLLLQVRTQVLDNDLRTTFCDWYPEMTQTAEARELGQARAA